MTVLSIELFARWDSTTLAERFLQHGLHWVCTDVVRADDPEQPGWKVLVFEEPPEVVMPIVLRLTHWRE